MQRGVANLPNPRGGSDEIGVNVTIQPIDGGFGLHFAGRLVLRQTRSCPAVVIARGRPQIAMQRGNFRIEDEPSEVLVLDEALPNGNGLLLGCGGKHRARLTISDHAIEISALDPAFDRIHLKFHAEPDETVWGGGEQLSYLALNGRRFPMWTSEPGVGRDKTTELTRLMDQSGMAGGDYWTTNYPQPTFLTSRWLAVHLDAACYSALDFTDPGAHAVEVWSRTARFELFAADGPLALVSELSSRFGRQPALPEWACRGAIVGLKQGLKSFDRLEMFIEAGATVSGLWCEDWAGIRETSFGRRLFWDWKRSDARYPDLIDRIAALRARGIRFLAYANPYLAVDGALFVEARDAGFLALKLTGDEPYAVDFGEFDAGVVDFTNPAAANWFAERILGREMLDIGIDGWMADFGEYLPTDLRLSDGSDPMEAHNRWPVLWAEVNAKALASRGKTGDALFFMRAGFSGVQAHSPLLWAGDQSVDFTRHDGIGTVITAALSSGLMGNAYNHSDCAGYTSLHGNVRSEELMQRWCELAAFAPVFRSHEGNRPDDNLQYDSNAVLLACFARWSRVHAALAPYVRHLCDEAVAHGWPAQRALFLHYPDDPGCRALQDQYLYGADLLVAPVIIEGATTREVVLPGSSPWRSVWTGEYHPAGTHKVAAPIGRPPVFYRPESRFAELFVSLPEVLGR